jgi:hypothetical protein
MALANWKRALVVGTLGAGAVLFLKGRRPAGVALAGVGLAVLVKECPEKPGRLWRDVPEFLDRASELVERFAQLGERAGREAERRRSRAWRKITSY